MTSQGINNSHTKCAKCGSCTVVCPVYKVTGRESNSARGRIHLLQKQREISNPKNLGEILSTCLLCGACANACPRGIDFRKTLVLAKGNLPKGGEKGLQRFLTLKALSRPRLAALLASLSQSGKNLLPILPEESGLRIRLGLQRKKSGEKKIPPSSPMQPKFHHAPSASQQDNGTSSTFFTGCHAAYLEPSISESIISLWNMAGHGAISKVKEQTCCGLAAYSAGDMTEAIRLAKINIAAFENRSSPILTACASCRAHLLNYPNFFPEETDWRERASMFAARLTDAALHFDALRIFPHAPSGDSASDKEWTIYFHTPCHSRFGIGKTSAPQELLSGIAGIKLEEPESGGRCCGMGGLFHLAHPRLAEEIGRTLIDELARLSPDLVLTSCSGCLMHIRTQAAAAGLTIPIEHFATFLMRFFSDHGAGKKFGNVESQS